MKLHRDCINRMSGSKKKYLSGFTLIEIIIVLGILAGLGSMGLFISMDFYKSYVFYSEQSIVVSIIQKARNHSMVNVNEATHGVKFESGQYTIFQGENYASRDVAYDEIIPVNPTITRTGIEEVVFSQLSGDSSISGNITMSDGLRSSIISIENEGRINW